MLLRSWNGYGDELAWAAAWIHKASGDDAFLEMAVSLYDEFGLHYPVTWGFGWDNKITGIQVKKLACMIWLQNYHLHT